MRHLLRTTFEDISGWEVAEAVNGREAIDKARELNPDLIVLDLSMPIMNGLQAARAPTHTTDRSDHLVYTLWE